MACAYEKTHYADHIGHKNHYVLTVLQGSYEPRTPCQSKETKQMERQLSLRSEQVLRDRSESAGTAVLFLSGTEPADCRFTESNDRWTGGGALERPECLRFTLQEDDGETFHST